MTADNMFLGNFDLQGIPPAPRGVPQISVTFDLDANGILTVTAEEATAGKGSITITQDKMNLSEEELQDMYETAKEWEERDAKKKKTVETRNTMESQAFNIKNKFVDAADDIGLDDDEMDTLKETCDDILEWLDANNGKPSFFLFLCFFPSEKNQNVLFQNRRRVGRFRRI